MELHQTEKLLHNEGNYKQGEKTTLRMGENNSKQSNWQRINLKIIQAAPEAQFQKNKWPNQKWAKELNRHFSKADIQVTDKQLISRIYKQLLHLIPEK